MELSCQVSFIFNLINIYCFSTIVKYFQTFFVSTQQDQPQTLSAYDLLTGTLVATFKEGGIANKNCVQVFGNNSYLISAEKDKPRIHIWNLNKKKSFHKTMITPGIINALLVLPSSDYLLAAIGNKIFIWMVSL